MAAAASASAQQMNIMKPSSTGIPGEECRVMAFDPAGNLWVAGRMPFWGESGLAMLSADQLEHQPLPVAASTPAPGASVERASSDSIALHSRPAVCAGRHRVGSDGWRAGAFRPNAAPADQWFTYTPANSPLLISGIRSIAIDSQGNVWIANAAVNVGGRGLFS
jgi:ligand-binding sensor domain-containing protein